MKRHLKSAGRMAVAPWLFFTLLLAGCATMMPLTSDPPGASATVNGMPVGITPIQVKWDKDQDNVVTFQLQGYFEDQVAVPRGNSMPAITVHLSPVQETRAYQINTEPEGATLALDGERVGTSPAQISIPFSRGSVNEAWHERILTVSLANYQTESYRLTRNIPSIGTIRLALLRDERVYRVSAVTRGGAPLKADIFLDGRPAGTTPLDLPLTFRRPGKFDSWPTFTVSARVPGQYKAEETVVDFERDRELRFVLSPMSEITTSLIAPGPAMTPNGVAWTMSERRAVAVLNTREASDAILNLKPVTNFSRQDLRGAAYSRVGSINSFAVSPDGQNIIFSLTSRDRDGNYYCNLFVKRADGASGGIAQLTQGTRYLDTAPKIANDGSNFLVFTSNRGDRSKPDIFRSNFIDNSLSGGISRLTNDMRFNFAPTYGEANRQLFYLSIEPNYPLAETQLSSIRLNGSLPTQMSVTALEIDNSVPDRVYFVRLDDDTKKMQIYSIQADGKLETALISQDSFRNSNCFDPAPSPDGGSRIAFVSDNGVDEQLRHNNDIYVMNSDGTGLERLTQNGSDDIKPAWSPSEDGVLYFLSNRGGAYNIWRLTLRTGANPSTPRPGGRRSPGAAN